VLYVTLPHLHRSAAAVQCAGPCEAGYAVRAALRAGEHALQVAGQPIAGGGRGVCCGLVCVQDRRDGGPYATACTCNRGAQQQRSCCRRRLPAGVWCEPARPRPHGSSGGHPGVRRRRQVRARLSPAFRQVPALDGGGGCDLVAACLPRRALVHHQRTSPGVRRCWPAGAPVTCTAAATC
jgi:hypothetical protein